MMTSPLAVKLKVKKCLHSSCIIIRSSYDMTNGPMTRHNTLALDNERLSYAFLFF